MPTQALGDGKMPPKDSGPNHRPGQGPLGRCLAECLLHLPSATLFLGHPGPSPSCSSPQAPLPWEQLRLAHFRLWRPENQPIPTWEGHKPWAWERGEVTASEIQGGDGGAEGSGGSNVGFEGQRPVTMMKMIGKTLTEDFFGVPALF